MALLENNLVLRKQEFMVPLTCLWAIMKPLTATSGTETLKVSGSTGSRVGVGPVPLWY